MEFQSLSKLGAGPWDAVCAQSADSWFWHTTSFLAYQEAYRPSLETKPLHFAVVRDRRPIAVVPLALENFEVAGRQAKRLTLGADYIPAPALVTGLLPSDRERVLRSVHEEVSRIAAETGAALVRWREAPLARRFASPPAAPANDLVRYGCMDASLATQVLGLRAPESELWANLRKSYHSAIRRAEERFEFRVYDQATVTDESFDEYRELHRRDAGRVTRPLETFRRMLTWVRSGHGFLTQARLGGRLLACALVLLYRGDAHYSSSCIDPDFEDPNFLGPFVQWNIIRELRRRDIYRYELGTQHFGPQFSSVPTPKEVSISFFKRGFGGASLPFFRGERYFSEPVLRAEFAARAEEVAASLFPSADGARG